MGSTIQMNIKEQIKYVDLSSLNCIDPEWLCVFMDCPDIPSCHSCESCIGNVPLVELEAIQKPLTIENLEDTLIKWEVLFK